ncbi:hypothetical protein [Cryptosporangium phraense]|uniref:hypothetical protein n=1 Tax=Cryptosporangium phraense TaxID=2593070 RepID=UPI0014789BA4|nr:hypothetical protein [Cryptosporangium phraense]
MTEPTSDEPTTDIYAGESANPDKTGGDALAEVWRAEGADRPDEERPERDVEN